MAEAGEAASASASDGAFFVYDFLGEGKALATLGPATELAISATRAARARPGGVAHILFP